MFDSTASSDLVYQTVFEIPGTHHEFEEIMQQSVIDQEWREELLQEGRQEEGRSLILRQLNHRIGDVSSDLQSQVQGLSHDQLEVLGEALLDFANATDLVSWLQAH